MPSDVTPDRTEYLEGEKERLQAQVDRLSGEAQHTEQEALRAVLRTLREQTEQLPPDSRWRCRLLLLGFDLASSLDGEHTTVEEFTAKSEAIAERRGH